MTTFNSNGPTTAINVSWTDNPVVQNSTKVKAVHTTELRTALTSLKTHTHYFPRTSGGVTSSVPDTTINNSWTDSTLTVNSTLIKAVHHNELIAGIKVMDGHKHTVVNYDGAAGTVGGDTNRDSAIYSGGFTFLVDPLVTNTDLPSVSSFEQLRTHLEALASHTHSICCECECQCTCTCTCTCTCECTCTCQCTCDCKGCG
jgi:hypothetical protein